MSDNVFLDALDDQRIVAIVRESSADDALALGERLIAAGIRLIEVSLVTPNAIAVVASLSASAAGSPTQIGAGTVLRADDVDRVVDVGGRFILSPVFDEQVVRAAVSANLAVVPGCATPSELLRATDLGAAAVKVFPASVWSPGSLRDALQALPGLLCLPTGGVKREHLTAWLDAGAAGVGLGSVIGKLDDDGIARLLEETRGHAKR